MDGQRAHGANGGRPPARPGQERLDGQRQVTIGLVTLAAGAAAFYWLYLAMVVVFAVFAWRGDAVEQFRTLILMVAGALVLLGIWLGFILLIRVGVVRVCCPDCGGHLALLSLQEHQWHLLVSIRTMVGLRCRGCGVCYWTFCPWPRGGSWFRREPEDGPGGRGAGHGRV